ncbi:MAG: hypothetical protein JWO11_2452 [Nocardioides sp.]|nr:hypothetical protein [Nocardioides sp.]
MASLRLVAPLGVAAAFVGLVAIVPATMPSFSEGDTSSESDRALSYRGPVATASGGSAAVLVYPAIVNTRLVRAEAALARATTWVDEGKAKRAVAELSAAKANMNAAWTAAKYVIRTTPPPVATGGAFAHASGGAPAGPSFASPEDTALAVFSLQHDAVTTSLGLLGAGGSRLNTTVSATIGAAADTRDAAIKYIHKIPVPPPPAGKSGGAHANASGGAVASNWATTMPSVLPLLDDEIQAIKGTRKINPTLPASSGTLLKATRAQDKKTEAAINKYWPPVVGDG